MKIENKKYRLWTAAGLVTMKDKEINKLEELLSVWKS